MRTFWIWDILIRIGDGLFIGYYPKREDCVWFLSMGHISNTEDDNEGEDMANHYKLDLTQNADGDVLLIFWDSIHGEDAFFIITDDGAFDGKDSDSAELKKVDLPAELKALMNKLQERKP